MAAPTHIGLQVDETACRSFQSTLSLSAPRPLEEFLPPDDHPDYLGTLYRLIGLELEHCWERFARDRAEDGGQTLDYPPRIEHYVTRFPRLARSPEELRRLIQREFVLRRQHGDRPSMDEYLVRFPDLFCAETQDLPAARTASVQGGAAVSHLPAPIPGPLQATFGADGADATARTIAGYRILGELGRGGMGVVYQAEQLSLKRVVALKMILAEKHVGAEGLARFRAEAEAVAHLQHPNIVQIYEVADHDGCPFFSLEFVEGGSLARALGGQSLLPAPAAMLVENLARAIHYAHQRGIVHRDLKPANVLVQFLSRDTGGAAALVSGERLNVIPKITDFGLAKRLDGNSGQTQSGAILGTPSYMAPEQAAGKVHDVGPLTDVYALGAILYEALTGRPPFRAATQMETMQQVLSQEVVPPSRLARVPRDLETICLKALAKDPGRRYTSAQALADDLSRFQAGEPIQARREGRLSRTWRQVKRRPALVASILLGLLTVAASAVVAHLVLKDTRSSQAAVLVRQIDDGMRPREWPEGRLAELESLLSQLKELDPDQAESKRAEVYSRYVDMLTNSFAIQNRPILKAMDVQRFETSIGKLKQVNAGLAAGVAEAFQKRLRKLQAHVLEPPFSNLAALVADPRLTSAGDTLLVSADKARKEAILTALPCLGSVELEVVLDPVWEAANRLVLLLNCQQQGSAYRFVFGVPDGLNANGDPIPAPANVTLGQIKQKNGDVTLQIFRDGHKLREQRLDANKVFHGDALTLMAARDGDRLSFQVNGLPPLVFYDSFPLTAASPGVFALELPAGQRLKRLRLATQALPPQASPLEHGDELYARGKFQEALDYYRQQDSAGLAREIAQEVRYKIGTCLLRLNRLEDAAPYLEEVAASEGNRWPPQAAFQLWTLRLKQHKVQQVDAILLDLSRRYSAEFLADRIPLEVRQHLLTAYTVQTLGFKFIRFDAQQVQKLERVVDLIELLRARDYDRLHLRLSLARAYHIAGRYAEALRELEKMLTDPTLVGTWPDEPHRLLPWQIRVVEEYGWVQRLAGDPLRAVEEIDKRLYRSPGNLRLSYLPLLLERARLRAFLKDWGSAEADLKELLQRLPIEEDYRYYGEAHWVLGHVRQAQGDAVGARKVWQEGTYHRWRERWKERNPGKDHAYPKLFVGTQFVTHIVQSSLAGALTRDDADDLIRNAITVALDEASAKTFTGFFRVTPTTLQQIWQSPRGVEMAAHMALRDVPWTIYQKLPAVALGVSMLRQGALPSNPTPDQDALAWKLAADMDQAYFIDGSIGKNQIFSLGTGWMGITGYLGWASAKNGLPQSLRGPAAYVFGLRYLHYLRRTDDARRFLQAALEEARRAPADPVLERLATAELERLADKK